MKNKNIDFTSISNHKNISINRNIKYLIHIPSKRLELTFNLISIIKPVSLITLLTPEIKKIFIEKFNSITKAFSWDITPPRLEYINIISPEKLEPSNALSLLEKKLKKFLSTPSHTLIDITGGNKLYSILLYNISQKYKINSVYLYTYEISTDKGLIAFPGEERLFIIQPNFKNFHNIIINKSFEIFITIVNSNLYIRFSIQNKTYQKIIPISKLKLNLFITKNKPFTFQATYKLSKYLYNKIFTRKLKKVIKNYKLIKFFFDKSSYFIPIDNYLLLKNNILTVRDFIYDKITIHKNTRYTNKILIIYSPLNNIEEKIFLDEANEIKKIFKKNRIPVTIKKMTNINNFLNLLKENWNIIHYIGHTDIDNKGAFFKIKKEKIYATTFKYIKSRFIFLNSCNSGNAVITEVKKSFPYILLQHKVKTMIGTLTNIESNKALSFSSKFYNNFIKSATVSEAFINTLNSFSSNEKIKLNYVLYGDYNISLFIN